MRGTYWVDLPDGQDAALIISIASCTGRIHADAEQAPQATDGSYAIALPWLRSS
jgi:hypothetical protein